MSNRQYDENGFYKVDRNPIARSGIFEYLGSSISPSLIPDKIYRVWRPDSELNNPETINSFKMIPWLSRHEMIGNDATPAEDVGVQGVTGDDVFFDSNTKTLFSTIKAYGKSLMQMIDSGIKELSIGMKCDWDIQSGFTPEGEAYDVIQRQIRGNHLASVLVGRAGPQFSVMDNNDVVSFAMDELDFKKTEQNEGKTMTIEEMLAALKELKPSLDQIKEIQGALAGLSGEGEAPQSETDPEMEGEAKDEDKVDNLDFKEKGAMDAAAISTAITKAVKLAVAPLTKEIETLKGQAMDAGAIEKSINRKNKLASECAAIVGEFDTSDKDETGVAKYFAEKMGMACDSGAELATVKGYLAGYKKPVYVADSGAQDAAEPVKSDSFKAAGL